MKLKELMVVSLIVISCNIQKDEYDVSVVFKTNSDFKIINNQLIFKDISYRKPFNYYFRIKTSYKLYKKFLNENNFYTKQEILKKNKLTYYLEADFATHGRVICNDSNMLKSELRLKWWYFDKNSEIYFKPFVLKRNKIILVEVNDNFSGMVKTNFYNGYMYLVFECWEIY
jgi:hypothetical protein